MVVAYLSSLEEIEPFKNEHVHIKRAFLAPSLWVPCIENKCNKHAEPLPLQGAKVGRDIVSLVGLSRCDKKDGNEVPRSA